MSMNNTPSGERTHIGFFGRRNAGKSSVVNAVTGQDLAVVSDVKGTTTDPVSKAMELLPLGPVMIIDTPGFDDEGMLGELRVKKTRQVLNKTDIAILVVDATEGQKDCDRQLIRLFREKEIPYLVVYNKADLLETVPGDTEDALFVSARTGAGIFELKEAMARRRQTGTDRRIIADKLQPGDFVVLVVPIDKAAPKGRLILPQQQTIRDILDAGAVSIVVKETELAQTLENLHRIDTVVLDKTGTLTTGKPAVTDVIPNGISEIQLMKVAASLEKQSEHPFAKAILAKAQKLSLFEVTDFETIPGRGVRGVINGMCYWGGNEKLMAESGISVPHYEEFAKAGKTPLYFASESTGFIGMIAAADVLKADSSEAVAAMKKLHLDVVMLTGDNNDVAHAIAAQAGIDHVVSDVLPGDKAGAVKKLQDAGKCVLMVGDGINDAPALVTADVGMAIGAGTDIAVESADVVLMSGNLGAVADAVRLSKATIRNIKQNLFWAFFYNCLGIPVAAGLLAPVGITLSPMLGAAAMSCSSVFVVTNALRLRRFRAEKKEIPVEYSTVCEIMEEEPIMETVIKVNGMMCPHCKARVEKVCKAVPGTVDAVVDLQAKTVTVTGDADVAALKQAIAAADYEVVE